jgi:hypothetical protein
LHDLDKTLQAFIDALVLALECARAKNADRSTELAGRVFGSDVYHIAHFSRPGMERNFFVEGAFAQCTLLEAGPMVDAKAE